MPHAGLKFGIFMAPFHRLVDNPTLAIHRDLELIEHLDRLGFDEAGVGAELAQLGDPRCARPGRTRTA